MVTKETTVVTAAIKVDVIALTPTVKVQTDRKPSAAIVANNIIIDLNASNASPTKARNQTTSVGVKKTTIPRLGLHDTDPTSLWSRPATSLRPLLLISFSTLGVPDT
jgi:hypothetical protein